MVMETNNSNHKAIWLALVVFPILCLCIGWFHVPRPVSAEKKTSFARDKLTSQLLNDVPKLNSPNNIQLGKQLQYLGANLPQGPVKPGSTVSLDFFSKPSNR